MSIKHVIIVASLSFLLSCASGGKQVEEGSEGVMSSRGDCIHEPSIRGYKVLDEQNLIVDTTGRKNYLVMLQRRAYGLRSSRGIAFDSPTSRLCAGFSEIIFNGGIGGGSLESIRISSIRLLTEEDEEDVLIRFGMKEPEIKQAPAPREVQGADVEELDPDASE